MEEILILGVVCLIIAAGVLIYFGVLNVKVNDKDIKESIPDVNVTVDPCYVCAKQCGFLLNYTK